MYIRRTALAAYVPSIKRIDAYHQGVDGGDYRTQLLRLRRAALRFATSLQLVTPEVCAFPYVAGAVYWQRYQHALAEILQGRIAYVYISGDAPVSVVNDLLEAAHRARIEIVCCAVGLPIQRRVVSLEFGVLHQRAGPIVQDTHEAVIEQFPLPEKTLGG